MTFGSPAEDTTHLRGSGRFAGLQPRKDSLLASFALHRWLNGPQIVKTVDYDRDGGLTLS